MRQCKQVAMMISLPETYRSQLRQLAAKKNMEDTTKVTSAAELCREIIIEHLIGTGQVGSVASIFD